MNELAYGLNDLGITGGVFLLRVMAFDQWERKKAFSSGWFFGYTFIRWQHH